MSTTAFPRGKTVEVARACVCLQVQRAARALARNFDDVFRPLGLTHGQFSLLMALNGPGPPAIGELAPFLAMDRTTLTALLKTLQRRGLAQVFPDRADRRRRLVRLTGDGHAMLSRAYPLWRKAHADLERGIGDAPGLRALLTRIAPPVPIGPAAPSRSRRR